MDYKQKTNDTSFNIIIDLFCQAVDFGDVAMMEGMSRLLVAVMDNRDAIQDAENQNDQDLVDDLINESFIIVGGLGVVR